MFILLIYGSILLLFSCQLVVLDDTTTTDNQIFDVIGFKIQEENQTPEYFAYKHEPSIENSKYFRSYHIHYINNKEEIIDAIYYTDLDQNHCFTISYLIKNNYEEISTVNENVICDKLNESLEYSFEKDESTVTVKLNIEFKDIDFLESFQVIEYDENSDQINIQNISLNNIVQNIKISSNTIDFIIVEKYKDQENQVYYKRHIHSKQDLTRLYDTFKYYSIHALNQNRDKEYYRFEFSLNDSEGENI